jgi:hypothetical protein
MKNALKQNPWLRALLEGLVIVGSILLAFGIEAWWDRRNDRSEEDRIISGLHDQFSRYREYLNGAVDYQIQKAATIQNMLLIIQENQWQEQAEGFDNLLGTALIPSTLDLGQGELESVISSGHLGLISDEDLVLKLVQWEGVLDEVRDDEIVIRNMILERFLPYLTRKGLPLGGSMEIMGSGEWPIPKRTLSGDPQKLEALCTDPEFAAMLEVLLGFTMHSGTEYHHTLQAIEDILNNLENY